MHPDDIIGLVACTAPFLIVIVAIMLKHQRKMAEMFHQHAYQATVSPETQMLRDEILELKSLVHQQAIALDSIARPVPNESRLQERVA